MYLSVNEISCRDPLEVVKVIDSMNAFDTFYSQIYGERWPLLRAAMLQTPEKVKRSCFQGHAEYVLDEASILAGEALGTQPGEKVLDLCAAPGGKALIILEALDGRGKLTANELSFARRKRLEEVMRTHVPVANLQGVQITGYDGNQFGLKRAGEFDRVLLDAPCSSERHLLEEDPSMNDWKESRTKQLGPRQYSLLCAALLALKPGGTLVYSTCSISPLENDEVVARLLKRKSDQVRLDESLQGLEKFEKTRVGFQIFPDQAAGAGPIYLSRLIKR